MVAWALFSSGCEEWCRLLLERASWVLQMHGVFAQRNQWGSMGGDEGSDEESRMQVHWNANVPLGHAVLE